MGPEGPSLTSCSPARRTTGRRQFTVNTVTALGIASISPLIGNLLVSNAAGDRGDEQIGKSPLEAFGTNGKDYRAYADRAAELW